MAEYNLGRVAFIDKGYYSAEETYNKWDFVTTVDSTYLFIGTTPQIGKPVTDTSFWKCIADGKPATLAAAAADLAKEAANNAATLANDKAILAQSAATLANTKAGLANDAAVLATDKAVLADSKATLANEKAALAQSAADNADEKAAEVTSAVLSAGQLGSIKPTDAAPTPARNGNYTFSIGGAKPAWLTAEAGVTTVKAGGGVSVVYTAPSSYTYTHIDVAFGVEQVRSQSTSKVPSSKLLDDELNKINDKLFRINLVFIVGSYYNSVGVLSPNSNFSYMAGLNVIKNKIYKTNLAGLGTANYIVFKNSAGGIISTLAVSHTTGDYFEFTTPALCTTMDISNRNSYLADNLIELYLKDAVNERLLIVEPIVASNTKAIPTLKDKIFKVDLTFIAGGYYNSTSSISIHPDFSYMVGLNAIENKIYKTNLAGAGNSYIVFRNSVGGVISILAVSNPANTFFEFTTPALCTTMDISNRHTVYADNLIELYLKNILELRVTDIESKLLNKTEVQNVIEMVNENSGYAILTGINESVQGFYSYSTGVFQAGTGKFSTKYDISELNGRELYISGITLGEPVALAIYVSDTNIILGHELNGNGTTQQFYTNYKLTIPIGCKYILSSNYGSYPTLSKNVLLLSQELQAEITKSTSDLLIANFENENIARRLLVKDNANPFVWKQFDKAYFSFTHDDANSYMEIFKNICDDYGFPFCPAVPYSNVGGVIGSKTVLEICHEIIANGGEILQHGSTPLTSETTDDQFIQAFRGEKMNWLSQGIDVNVFIMIGGTGDLTVDKNKTQKLCLRYMKMSDKYGLTPQYTLSRTRPDCISGEYTTILNLYKAVIDDAIANKKWIRFYGHNTTEVPEQVLRDAFAYIATKIGLGVADFVTWSYMYDNFASTQLENRLIALEAL